MARDRVTRLGETLLAHRERTPFAEVDLIFRSRDQIILIEVKTVTANWDTSFITAHQLSRLFAARSYIEEDLSKPASLLIALVSLGERSIRYVQPAG